MTVPSRIRLLHDAGVSVWLNDLSRRLLDDGVLARYVAGHRLSGVTSNPAIFAAALRDEDRYDAGIDDMLAAGVRDPRAMYFALALRDVGDAAELLRETYVRSDGRDGSVSFECTPDVAHDTRATVRQAMEVWARVARPNLMIKVPATRAGIAAIEELTTAGINVNVTLLFFPGRHERAARAYPPLAFADHGAPHLAAPGERRARIALDGSGVRNADLAALGTELQAAGVRAFRDAYATALDRLRQGTTRVAS